MALKFARERFTDFQHEMGDLIRQHWREIANPDTPALDMDWGSYGLLERADMLPCLTARTETGELVGYVLHVTANSLHYRTHRFANDDAHYLRPDHRMGWNAVHMFQAAEAMLIEEGVNSISYHHKTRPDIDKGVIFERLGYRPVERIYTKIL